MSKIVEVNQALANRIEVDHLKDGGYQRTLDTGRLREMSETLSRKGRFVPPIILAQHGNRLSIVDGQHRLEAWKLGNFTLQAMIVPISDRKEAARAFVDINAKQRRVARPHILQIADDEWSVEVRRLAKVTGCSLLQAHGAMLGCSRRVFSGEACKVTEEMPLICEKVINTWMRDKRWNAPQSGCFSKPGILNIACAMCKHEQDEKKMDVILKKLLALNYGEESAINYVYGTGRKSILLTQKEIVKQVR